MNKVDDRLSYYPNSLNVLTGLEKDCRLEVSKDDSVFIHCSQARDYPLLRIC